MIQASYWLAFSLIGTNISIIIMAYGYRRMCKELNEINLSLMWINMRLKGWKNDSD